MSMTASDRMHELETLVAAHQRGVWRFLRFIGATPVEADDLTQETFLAVWQKPFEQRDEHATGAYLRTVARHRFLMLLRSRRRRPEVQNIENAEQVFAATAGEDGGDDHIDALRECMQQLQGRARSAVDLFYGDGHSRAETARLLEMDEEGVKTLLRRAKQALRECVERKHGRKPG